MTNINGGKITKLTKEYLKNKTKEFDVSCIYSLNISNIGLFDIGCIGECLGLTVLDVSANSISSVRPLAPLKQLQILKMSRNRISDLSGLEELESLFTLDLCSNFISSVDSLWPLTKLEKFAHLRLSDAIEGLSNPVCQNNESYKQQIMDLLPDLKTLNGQILSGKGSEFQDLCEQLDETFKGIESSTRQRAVVSLVNEPYPSTKSLSSHGEPDERINSHEKKFEESLRQCELANAKAEMAAKRAEESLSM
ncbi:leucine-rich repeat-containing protein 61-like isoform X1 [Rhopilema esculentum]|uniref:leucine-rich repeat-containing protein 61-like isoform X1 n=1 Tax=Rhopilema esculentum TaxID=499914 RepID=UPI0031DB273E